MDKKEVFSLEELSFFMWIIEESLSFYLNDSYVSR